MTTFDNMDFAERSNEIPTAQTLLAELGVADGAIVTLDAPRCQKRHFAVAADANVALIVGGTDNQPTLHQQVQKVAATTTPLGSLSATTRAATATNHRTVTVFDPANKLADTDWHPHVVAIIQVARDVYTRNAKTALRRHSTQTAFYVSNTPVTAARAAEAIRALEDREYLPPQPQRYLWRKPLAHPHQPRRVRPPAKLRFQHPQGQPNKHTQSGPLPRRSRRHQEPALTHRSS